MFYKILSVTAILFSVNAYALDEQVLIENAMKRAKEYNVQGLIEKVQDRIANDPYYKKGADAGKKLTKERSVFDAVDDGGDVADMGSVNVQNLLARYGKKLDAANNKETKLNQLLIFVSLSMPAQSLKQLDVQAKKAGGLLVMRGLVDNSFKETVALLADVDDGLSAVIDPRLFEMYQIETVPAFVVNPTDNHPCFDSKCNSTPLHDKISGDISLEYALEQLSSQGDVSKEVATQYLNKLRGEGDD